MGNGGHAFAAYLALNGQTVRAWDVDATRISELQKRGTIEAKGIGLTGTARLELFTADLAEAVTGADVILVVIPTIYHASVAEQLAKHLTEGQLVILNPGATGGALEVRSILRCAGAASVTVCETNNMVFTCRSEAPGEVTVNAIKNKVDFACLPASATDTALAQISAVLPQFNPVDNVLVTSLGNINAMVHPVPTILNAARCDAGAPFEYYLDGITPTVAALVERLDRERIAIAEAFKLNIQSLPEWYSDSYGRPVDNLYDAVHNNTAYVDIAGPTSLQNRYLIEDVATGLVPLSELGRAANVPTALIDAAIEMASSLLGLDFRQSGRTLTRLELSELSIADMLATVS